MKKYLVVSDNHGDRDVLVDLANEYRGKVDLMFHCGDSELDPLDELWLDFYVVTGNCDYDRRFKQKQVVSSGTDKILVIHGHRHNVRFGLQQLAYAAEEEEANIVLFGHTHELGVEMVKGTMYLNSGSISQPRGRYNLKTYAVIESDTNQFKVQYYTRDHQPLKDLVFTFKKG